MNMLRLFDDDRGESRLVNVDVPMTLHDDSPPAKPHYFSEFTKNWSSCNVRLLQQNRRQPDLTAFPLDVCYRRQLRHSADRAE